MASTQLRVATRGSKLALWQARYIAGLLDVQVEFVVVETTGDQTQRSEVPIEQMSGQGIFVKEVELVVLQGKADFAVHSAKDLPSVTADGLALAAVPLRGDPRDALVGSSLEFLPVGARVATGSVRRRAQLAALRPDIVFSGLRGNVDTRIKKTDEFDAVIMAHAPIERLQLDYAPAFPLDVNIMVPQVGQGALAVECRDEDHELRERLAVIEHTGTRRSVDCERAFLAAIGSGCDLPVGAYAYVDEDEQVRVTGLLASFDGSAVIKESAIGPNGQELGATLAKTLLARGGFELLRNRASNEP